MCLASYNGEQFVEKQLLSVLSQLSDADEVVVSDDSSTDRTVNVIESLNDSRIRLFKNNRFASPTFNFEHALSKARNGVLVLCDQDDEWLPNKVAIIRRHFSPPPCAAYAIVLDGSVIDSDGNETHPSLFAKIGSGPGIVKNLYDNTFMGCCMAFTRKALELASPFPKNIPMHDMWLGQVTSVFGRVDFVQDKTLRYRKHHQSLTDFRREFRPFIQVSRRLNLLGSLALRTWQRRSELASRVPNA